MLPKNFGKGSALRELARMLNVPMTQTISIGDNLNGITLIQDAAVGVAAANADPELKKVIRV